MFNVQFKNRKFPNGKCNYYSERQTLWSNNEYLFSYPLGKKKCRGILTIYFLTHWVWTEFNNLETEKKFFRTYIKFRRHLCVLCFFHFWVYETKSLYSSIKYKKKKSKKSYSIGKFCFKVPVSYEEFDMYKSD